MTDKQKDIILFGICCGNIILGFKILRESNYTMDYLLGTTMLSFGLIACLINLIIEIKNNI